MPAGQTHTRKRGKRADYVLRFRTDLPIAILEAKAEYKKAWDGMNERIEYRQLVQVKLASLGVDVSPAAPKEVAQ